jgi:hypothetical protein
VRKAEEFWVRELHRLYVLIKGTARSEQRDRKDNRLEKARLHERFLEYFEIEIIRMGSDPPPCNRETRSIGGD